MLKTILVLPDGTELSSGAETTNAIKSITITECVNDKQELSLGSTCANMIELTVISPNGGFSIAKGDEFAVYREDSNGIRHLVGLYTSEKPTRASAHSLKVTAYDRVSWLDKDLTKWLSELNAWPYALYDLANMVCEECDLVLLNQEIPNGSYLVERFSVDGITGRQIMRWVGEIAGRFCRATPEGQIEFAWYTPASATSIDSGTFTEALVSMNQDGEVTVQCDGITAERDNAGNVELTGEGLTVTDDGQGNVVITLPTGENVLLYYQTGLRFSEYQVAPIEKVQIKGSQDDIGTVYPPDRLESVNTYIISGNYLLTATDAEDLQPIAQTLYEHLRGVTYTPCTVSIPASFRIHAGDIVSITDRNGVTITAYVMTKKQVGQRDLLESTGSARRDSSSAVNEQSYAAIHGKVLNLQMNVEGLRIENQNTAGKLASLSLNLEGITSMVQSQENSLESILQDITQIKQDSDSVKVSVQAIEDNGVSKVETETGFTFDNEGLHINKSDSDIENLLDESGMYIRRNDETLLQANDDGVTAVDVTVQNYLVVGSHARFEDYADNRTACFWL